jgi:hypothetical protein
MYEKNLLFLLVCLLGCESGEMQTTSGRAYLAKYKDISNNSTNSFSSSEQDFQKELIAVASVEPILQFLAKIGIVRIHEGYLSTIPPEEIAIFEQYRNKVDKDLGAIVPFSLIVSDTVGEQYDDPIYLMRKIRLTAARQHMDAVLVYETTSQSNRESNLLDNLGDLILIGDYVLPSQKITASGQVSAVLIDVMQAYPYGQVYATTKNNVSYSTTNRQNDALDETKREQNIQAVKEITPKVIAMLKNLKEKFIQSKAKTK